MTLARRELLSLVLGAPLASEACRFPPPRVDGELLGTSLNTGHRLRETHAPPSASLPEERVAVAVVGGGPSGLTAAWRLERLGVRDFTVLELEPNAGGTSAYGDRGDVPYPWGAHYLPVPRATNRQLVTLLREFGLLESSPGPAGEPVGVERWLVRAPEERIFVDGSWHRGAYPSHGATPEDQAELERFQALIGKYVALRDGAGRRAFDLPLSRSSDDASLTALDRESASAFLDRHGLRSQRLRWVVDYACRDDYGLALEDTSAWAMLFYFASRLDHPGGESKPFLTWPEGNGALVKQLVRVAGPRLRTGQLVLDVIPREDGVELLVEDVKRRAMRRIIARHAILALPKFIVKHLLKPYREQRPAHLEAFTYSPWLVANLHLSARPESQGFPLCWENLLYDGPSVGYVAATHQTLRERGPTVFTYYLPLVRKPPEERRRILELDLQQLQDPIVADLARAHTGFRELLTRVDVWRWGHAMIRPTPGFIWGPERRKAAAPLGRVHFAHSDLSGIPLFEEALDHGVRAAEAVAAEQGVKFESLSG